MLLQWHVKSPGSFCLKCRWQITFKHTYTLDPSKLEWAGYAAVQAQCGNLSQNELTCNSSRNTCSQLSQLTDPLWTDPGLKSGISLHELISTLKKKKCRRGMNCRTFSPNPCMQAKSHHHQQWHSFVIWVPFSSYVALLATNNVYFWLKMLTCCYCFFVVVFCFGWCKLLDFMMSFHCTCQIFEWMWPFCWSCLLIWCYSVKMWFCFFV